MSINVKTQLKDGAAVAAELRDYHQQLIEAFELYEQVLNSGCSCYSDPDGTCPHCGLIERARRKAKAIVGDYTQY